MQFTFGQHQVAEMLQVLPFIEGSHGFEKDSESPVRRGQSL
jgi:hypothetical protein